MGPAWLCDTLWPHVWPSAGRSLLGLQFIRNTVAMEVSRPLSEYKKISRKGQIALMREPAVFQNPDTVWKKSL